MVYLLYIYVACALKILKICSLYYLKIKWVIFHKMYVCAFKLNLIECYYSLFIFTGIFYKKRNTG